jgi:hypothetical protein
MSLSPEEFDKRLREAGLPAFASDYDPMSERRSLRVEAAPELFGWSGT